MRRSAAVVAALVAATGLVTVPAIAADDESEHSEWTAEPTLVGGTSRYDHGEWVYNDFVFDDYGADTGSWGQPNYVSLAGTSGDGRYPVGEQFADNAADIVEVRVRQRGSEKDALQVRVQLQTLIDASVPAIYVESGEFSEVFTNQNAVVDLAENTVTFTMPGTGGNVESVDLMIGAGLNDGAGELRAGVPGNQDLAPEEYTTGGPTDNRLLDVAFNSRDDEPRGGPWNEDAQSDALAAGDLSAFVETIDLSYLDNPSRSTELTFEPGYYVRLFESDQGISEGMKGRFPQYGGTLQPYALWVPDSFDPAEPTKLFLNMHSLSVHHNQYRGGTSPTYRTFYEQFGDGLDAIVITPLGRGPDGWYKNEAFVDTLEVWADALATFPNVDRDKTIVSGYSMGGYGTYRFSTLMPDAFASAVSIVGPPTDGIWLGQNSSQPYLTYHQLENTRHVPFWITHGVLDELVPVYGVTKQAQRFGELDHEYRYALHPVEDHLTFSAKDMWSREVNWFAEHPNRVENPSDITLRIRLASVLPDRLAHLRPLVDSLLAEIGARVDGGYWVDDVVVAGEGDVTGAVNLTSLGLAQTRTVTPVASAGPGVIDGPSPYVLTGDDVTYTPAVRSQKLVGTLADVASLTVDACRAGFSAIPTLDITTNVPVTITFVCGAKTLGTKSLAPASA